MSMELWELAARESIRDLVARYAHAADRGRLDELGALFADGGVLRIDEREPLVGPDAIRSFLGATQSSVRSATRSALIRHHVSNLQITIEGREAASGASYFFVVTERGPDHWGRYRDRYRPAVDGAWRFAERRVRMDGFAPGSWAEERRRTLES
jgi:3-phenylpropionate/cinnamic acid dioxygenase small subunit